MFQKKNLIFGPKQSKAQIFFNGPVYISLQNMGLAHRLSSVYKLPITQVRKNPSACRCCFSTLVLPEVKISDLIGNGDSEKCQGCIPSRVCESIRSSPQALRQGNDCLAVVLITWCLVSIYFLWKRSYYLVSFSSCLGEVCNLLVFRHFLQAAFKLFFFNDIGRFCSD